jgi:hypothetical protein
LSVAAFSVATFLVVDAFVMPFFCATTVRSSAISGTEVSGNVGRIHHG